jgi:hypothetical protein
MGCNEIFHLRKRLCIGGLSVYWGFVILFAQITKWWKLIRLNFRSSIFDVPMDLSIDHLFDPQVNLTAMWTAA